MRMRLISGIVRRGKVELESSDVPPDGTTVTVLIHDEETFELTPKEEKALLKSIKQAERGQVVDGWKFLRQLRRQARRR
jgi:hypothetical protein